MKKLDIKKIVLGSIAENCYLILNGQESLLIDPGDNAKGLIDYLDNQSIKISSILITHAHFDHIGAVDDIVNKYHCKVYIQERDVDAFYDDQLNLSSHYNPLQLKSKVIPVNGNLNVDGFNITYMNLPGHTHGSSFILFNDFDIVFSGDVLFKGSIGQYRFPTSSIEETKETIDTIKSIETNYIVYPGHGETTTIFDEQKNNPFLNYDFDIINKMM